MNEQQKHIESLSQHFWQKGYRGHFFMKIPTGNERMETGELKTCLKAYLKQSAAKENSPRFLLETDAPYRDELRCSFEIDYDENKGFKVRFLNVSDKKTHKKKLFVVETNHRIPGATAISTYFPRPKPWDNHLKGRFRP